MFRLNVPVVIRVKVKEVRNNVVIYSHALLRICIIGGQRSVRIATLFRTSFTFALMTTGAFS